jgi:microsomal dipeptidase-like Zn-dependent dipeptidase
MWLDLSHATDKTSTDILKLAKHVVASHVGFRGIKDFKRNISLEVAKEIAHKGGLIGIIPWSHLSPSDESGHSTVIEFGLKHNLEKALCIGTDFGAPIKTHNTNRCVLDIALKVENDFPKYSDQILWKNAYSFYQKIF